jgi:hypothetical protein
MESVASVTLSVGSTTAIGVEDDANNFSVVILWCIHHVCHTIVCHLNDYFSLFARAQIS